MSPLAHRAMSVMEADFPGQSGPPPLSRGQAPAPESRPTSAGDPPLPLRRDCARDRGRVARPNPFPNAPAIGLASSLLAWAMLTGQKDAPRPPTHSTWLPTSHLRSRHRAARTYQHTPHPPTRVTATHQHAFLDSQHALLGSQHVPLGSQHCVDRSQHAPLGSQHARSEHRVARF